MKTIQKLRSIINKINFRKHEKSDTATVHYYIQITGRYGVKFYKKKRAMEECFFRQNAAHFAGFGPKALFKGKKKDYYYYVTEHAEQGKNALNREEIAEVRKNVAKMGWSTYDLYGDNVGKVNGKPVLIDFDTCTIG
jgi:translation elongation factor EF-Ts